MSNLVHRALTALVAGSATILAILYSPYGLWFFCTLVSLVGLWEFLQVQHIKARRFRLISLGIGMILWLAVFLELFAESLLEFPQQIFGLIAILLLPLLEIAVLFDPKETDPLKKLGAQVLGFIYCFLPLFLLYKMSVPAISDDYDFHLPLGILFLTWILDTGAYFVGRMMGKRPLFSRVSPKKTWEGAIGGALLCIGLGAALQAYMPHESKRLFSWIVVAVIIAIFSQLGDLVESMYKRSIELKDSGNILPGHGGMLDRFDGLYLSIPFIYLYYSML